jgi:predicted Fe-Mo cluster-binding NifX family protein
MRGAERRLVAVPSEGPGGLPAERSGHFGHCECFTLVGLEDGRVAEVRVIRNGADSAGGCLAPVQLLADLSATNLIVSAIGGRPLLGFQAAGIDVHHDPYRPLVAESLDALLRHELLCMTPEQACGGHGGCAAH